MHRCRRHQEVHLTDVVNFSAENPFVTQCNNTVQYIAHSDSATDVTNSVIYNFCVWKGIKQLRKNFLITSCKINRRSQEKNPQCKSQPFKTKLRLVHKTFEFSEIAFVFCHLHEALWSTQLEKHRLHDSTASLKLDVSPRLFGHIKQNWGNSENTEGC